MRSSSFDQDALLALAEIQERLKCHYQLRVELSVSVEHQASQLWCERHVVAPLGDHAAKIVGHSHNAGEVIDVSPPEAAGVARPVPRFMMLQDRIDNVLWNIRKILDDIDAQGGVLSENLHLRVGKALVELKDLLRQAGHTHIMQEASETSLSQCVAGLTEDSAG